MKFDEITEDGRLWATRYDGMQDNILFCTFHNWLDVEWLQKFFTEHSSDLLAYFNIIDLDNNRTTEMFLGKEKAKGFRTSGHSSWLRLYALKLEPQIYIITGGAIKLTHTMNERQHTIDELQKLEHVRCFLIENGVVDLEGMIDYNNETNG